MTKAQELIARIQKQKEEVSALQQLWASVFPEFETPDQRQCQVWLKFYTFEQVVEGVATANTQYAKRQSNAVTGGPMDRDNVLAYASGVMKGLKRKAEAEAKAEAEGGK